MTRFHLRHRGGSDSKHKKATPFQPRAGGVPLQHRSTIRQT